MTLIQPSKRSRQENWSEKLQRDMGCNINACINYYWFIHYCHRKVMQSTCNMADVVLSVGNGVRSMRCVAFVFLDFVFWWKSPVNTQILIVTIVIQRWAGGAQDTTGKFVEGPRTVRMQGRFVTGADGSRALVLLLLFSTFSISTDERGQKRTGRWTAVRIWGPGCQSPPDKALGMDKFWTKR